MVEGVAMVLAGGVLGEGFKDWRRSDSQSSGYYHLVRKRRWPASNAGAAKQKQIRLRACKAGQCLGN